MNRRRGTRMVLTAGLMAAAGVGCGTEPPPGPVSGDLILSVTTPSTTDGAMLLSISGGPVESVTALGGLTIAGAPSATTYRVVLTGNIVSGDYARMRVPDVSKVTQYAVTIEQIADRHTFVLRDPAGTSTAIRR